ncbi:MAG: hypothetical protein P8166_02400 [Candidatus Thiodiazotropha sp.]
MKHKITLLLFSLAILLTSLNTSAGTNSANDLLDQMISSYGGAKTLEKLNRPYNQVWQLDAVSRNAKGNDKRYIALPDVLKVELTYPHNSETRILEGDQGVKIYDKTKHVDAKGPALDAMRLQRMRLYNPLLLKQRAANIKLSEKDGHYCLTLSEGGLIAEYFVNKQTNLIDTVIGTLQMGGRKMQFRTEYQDYKMEDGVMLPHREVKYAGSVNTAVLTLVETSFNAVSNVKEI